MSPPSVKRGHAAGSMPPIGVRHGPRASLCDHRGVPASDASRATSCKPREVARDRRKAFAVIVLTCLGLVLLAAAPALNTHAAPLPDSGSELIAAVNALRASYGLAPYKVDPILMAVAQAQNNYSISIGSVTHYGPDGSRPRDQAIAAGYGGGATVFVSENIQEGTGLSPSGAVQAWTGDDPHLNTMIGSNYRDVGAGAGERAGVQYYTLIAGYVAGGFSANSTVPAGGITLPGLTGVQPVYATVTPQPDGSIVHVVQTGQTLWTIAAVYGVPLDELLKQNKLTQYSFIHAGDRIVIQGAVTPTATLSPTYTPPPPTATLSEATATRRPSSTPRATATSTPSPILSFSSTSPAGKAMIIAGVVMVVIGLVFGMLRGRSTAPSEH
jgi:uncharacterized protein YkwD